MDVDKIGNFIRKLRTDKDLSQYDLADMIPIDRSVVSKWERGEVLPPVDKMKILCDIFNITIDELISGELKTKENEKEHENNLFNYLLSQDIKNKKLKLTTIILFLLTLIVTFSFLVYYFIETHNTEKIYRITGESENYVLRDGILILTREKTYMKIGSIDKKNTYEIDDYEITLYYMKDGKREDIYTGNSDLVLKDMYGYNAVLNNSNIDNIKNNLYIDIDGEEVKLNLLFDYNNNNYVLDDWIDYNNDPVNFNDNLEIDIDKIKKEFKCDDIFCKKIINNIEINYLLSDDLIYLSEEDINISYDVSNRKFIYLSDILNFDITNGVLNCKSSSCDNYEEIYNKYYTNIIKNYLK